MPGRGRRKFERHASSQAAEARAVELRHELAAGTLSGTNHTLDDAMQSFADHLRGLRHKESTLSQYRSNYNCWVPESVGAKPLAELGRADWTAVCDGLAMGATPGTTRAVIRTMNALIAYCDDRELFGGRQPFDTSRERRKSIAHKALDLAAARAGSSAGGDGVVELTMCPTMHDALRLADTLELHYPLYGKRLVLLGYATGARIGELLALQDEHLNVDDGLVNIVQQLDRARPWPAVKPPKGGDSRQAHLCTWANPIAESLIADARARTGDDAGWLFPRHRSETGWVHQAGKLIGAAIEEIDWPWTFHWLRHGYASWLLAPPAVGGYGMDPTDVQHWLGHKRRSTTSDYYVQPTPSGLAAARIATARTPGPSGGLR